MRKIDLSRTRIKTLDPFFKARTVAIIGASKRAGRVGNVLLRNFIDRKFRGRVYPINPKYDEILGRRCYPTILDVPEDVDLAIIAVRADRVPELVRQCGRKGVRCVVVLSGGFREIGPEGAERERKLLEIAKKYNMRIIGPNCIGVYDAYTGIDTLFLPPTRLRRAKEGGLAFISQSGAFLAAIMDLASSIGIGFSKAISYGNRVDVDESDLIEYLMYDEDTRVIAAYIESLGPGTGKKFIEVIKRVVYHKPVVVIKGGKGEAGLRAAASHTGALAGSYRIFSKALKQAGAIEVKSFEEMFDVIKALMTQPLMRGKRILMLTNGGGLGVLTTDAAEEYGFIVPKLSETIQTKLRENFPERFVVHNPVDVTADGTAEHYGYVLDTVLPSEEVDAAVVGILFQTPALGVEVVDSIAMAKRFRKPILAISIGGELSKQISEMLELEGIPTYESPERAIRALRALYDYSIIKLKSEEKVKEVSVVEITREVP